MAGRGDPLLHRGLPGGLTVAARRVLVLPPFRDNARRVLDGLPEVEVVACPTVARGPSATDELFAVGGDLIADRGCTHVIATAERNMAVAGRLRDAYGLPGLNWIQSLAVTDKRSMRLWAALLVPMAAGWPSNEVLADPGVLSGLDEVVIKPATGAGCHRIERMPTGRALLRLTAEPGPWQVEEALDVDVELHCDGYFTDRNAPVMVVSAYDRPLLTSIGTTQASFHLPADHPWSRRAHELTTRLLAGAPASRAAFHVEVLLVGDRALLGEIAMRPASGGIAESLLLHHRLDVWAAFVRLQAGLTPLPVTIAGPADWSGVAGVVADGESDESRRAEELRGLPGVVAVEHVGVRLSDLPGTSSAFMWHVYFQAPSEADARALVQRIAQS